ERLYCLTRSVKTSALYSLSACQTWTSVAAQAVEATPIAAAQNAVVNEVRQRWLRSKFFIFFIFNYENPVRGVASPLHLPAALPSPHSWSNQDYYGLY